MNKQCSHQCLLLFVLLFSLSTFAQVTAGRQQVGSASNEVIYHIFLRSFYDADGDSHGDLQGLHQKLPYLQELGITAILLTPINSSVYYHNYFSDDFEKIDAEFGNMQTYINLVKDIHNRGMKIYLDMETQYVTEDHIWWKDSYKNPASVYSDYILYNDKANTQPESIIFNLTSIPGYNGVNRKATTVNLNSKKVFDYNYNLFKSWIDPDRNGQFDDGADGFRLDHAMDDLDLKGKLTGLFEKFWKPLVIKLKQVNPNLMIVAEQANWAEYGADYFEKAKVDRVFAFRLQHAFLSFNKQRIQQVFDSSFSQTPAGKQQVVFLENHDMQRFATAVRKDPAKEKAGAALNLLTGGIPLIYYGQELGMFGSGGFGKFGMTDANDIPMREAFEWYRSDSGSGMALWYKNTGPWWDSTNLKPNDGISLEEQKTDPGSLYNFYRTLLHLRKAHPALYAGAYQPLFNNNGQVFTFLRATPEEEIIVAINLSGIEQQSMFDAGDREYAKKTALLLYPAGKATSSSLKNFRLPPYGLQIWKLTE